MAGGGKVSARQKMINLMYLVFIAMIAMNVSKDVLSAFGNFEKKFVEVNALASETNERLIQDLEQKAEEKPEEFAFVANKAVQISQVSNEFYNYIEQLKRELLAKGPFEVDSESGELNYEEMDKTDLLNNWFTGDRLSNEGEAVFERIKKYKDDIRNIIGYDSLSNQATDVKYIKALEVFDRRFDLADQFNSNDKKFLHWLDYNFKGFPAIASYAKMSAIQNDVKVTETNLYNLFIGNTLDFAITLNNYKPIVLADKSAFFAGEQFQGRIVLGKYSNVTPISLILDGKPYDLTNAIDSSGAAKVSFNVGNVGEHTFEGVFTFLEDGKNLEKPFQANYVVVPRPNSASVSADKMNVVYIGLDNPLTIAFPGVPDNKVVASAPNLTKTGNGKYVLKPESGTEVVVSVSATLDDGSKVNDKRVFRIKQIPKPTSKIAGKDGSVSLNRRDLTTSRVLADFGDFVYDLNTSVYAFDISVPGQPTIAVAGDRLSPQAIEAVNRAPRNSNIIIKNIKVRAVGVSPDLIKPATTIAITLTN